jgi:hypothetical protein
MDAESTRPLWELVVVGLVSATVGGVLGAWVQTRHERLQHLRDRMLAAADEVATGLIQAVSAPLFEEATRNKLVTFPHDDLDEMRFEARRRIDVVLHRMGRVELLFGQGDTSGAGYEAVKRLTQAVDVLERKLDRAAVLRALSLTTEASEQTSHFAACARRAIMASSPWSRARVQLRDRRVRRRAARRRPRAAELPPSNKTDPG